MLRDFLAALFCAGAFLAGDLLALFLAAVFVAPFFAAVLLALFFAPVLLALFFETDFCAGAFLAADLPALFFAVLFFATDFLAADFWADAFLAVDFLAADFLAADFLAPPFLLPFGQPSCICSYASFETVERDFGLLVPAAFFLLMLFTSEFFLVAIEGQTTGQRDCASTALRVIARA